ncbi:iron-responsive element-binding protein 2 isoform X3 [Canis lupus baileyi]|uniref:Iron-responsive element-binding protein 2 n=3 Tax=Canis lupus TaxID=9612 RepID=A0A8C0MM25_CANLF|nr:iron-responsive element-binding protein 2 isoform X2 [Canis lupus dingo]XP_038411859.1 iron-responsive element-binding protein 2 isoform X2 [Canis lupus familiaris]XP_038541397.1 iron-responsive element-binding protein 2 isoform X2 [Canis lupus familiaris]XP_038546685.1 iron-responsive element-binding protein 2 isoform X2 [Canis lupus familiaris]
MDAPGAGRPFEYLIETLNDSSRKKFYNVPRLGGTKYGALPYSIRVLLEAAVRNCDGFLMKKEDVMNILDWKTKQSSVEVPFFPARVLLQDFTGIPAMVDFAAMREAVKILGGDPRRVHPARPTDLTVDHSLQIDFSKCAIQNAPNPGGGDLQKAGKLSPLRVQPKKLPCRGQTTCRGSCDSGEPGRNSGKLSSQIENTPILCPFHLQPVPEPETVLKNQEVEFGRNRERLQFFKWSSRVFKNVAVIPPGTGMAHQVNLEYLSRMVFEEDNLLFPDSVVGTDSHITMVNGLGILGWGVGGIETEAVMLGLPVSLTLPEVVGCELSGSSNPFVTSIDVVLGITKHLRQVGVAGKFVEFFGSGVSQLSIVDRTTIANMCPEYGAILSFFPVDNVTLKHLEHTGFDKAKLKSVETYLKAVKLFRHDQDNSGEPTYSQVIRIHLNSIVPSVSGPKRPQDRVAVTDMKRDFQACLNEKVGFKGFQIAAEKQKDYVCIRYEGSEYTLSHGSVVLAAVTSCTNNCNPSVMLAAGLLAKKAVDAGLHVKPYIRTSLSPGSGMVTHYLSSSGVLPYLSKLGFEIVGYGCSTCVGNTAPLPEAVLNAVKQGDLVTCGVLSGNKNFEGRLCDCVRANYLASPPLVVAYAIAGTVNIDFQTEPLGTDPTGRSIYLQDIWPSREEVHQMEEERVVLSMFKVLKEKMETKEPVALRPIENAHVLLYLGDSVTTDHISPAGSIARSSAAAKYLTNRGLTPREFNSYGARRGNDAVMTRGTFANIKLFNKFLGKPAPKTIHFPSGQTLDVFEAAELYQKDGVPLIILAGKKYGSGNSRDWAAKGPYLLGVKAVLAESYEKIHKDHLIGIGIVPLQFLPGENAESLGLSGRETFSLTFPEELSPGLTLSIKTSTGKVFSVIAAFENDVEVTLYRHGGLLNFVARKFS